MREKRQRNGVYLGFIVRKTKTRLLLGKILLNLTGIRKMYQIYPVHKSLERNFPVYVCLCGTYMNA